MSIDGITLLNGATGVTVTGGTAAVFTPDGLEVKNGIHVIDTSVADKTVRPHATFKSKGFAAQPDGTYSKGTRSVNYTLPKSLASSKISYQVFRGTFEIHPEMSDAEILQIRLMACQLIMDAELDNFYNNGSVK